MQHRIEISSEQLNVVIAAMRTHHAAKMEEFMQEARSNGYRTAGVHFGEALDDIKRAEDFFLHLRACDPAMRGVLNRDSNNSDPAKTFGSDYRADEPR